MMPDYDVIDAHVHTYPTPEIGKQALSGFDGSGCCGTPEELTGIMKAAGVRLAVQCNMTPARSMLEANLAAMPKEQRDSARPALVEKIGSRIMRRNAWTCGTAQENRQLIPFVSVDPMMGRDRMTAELNDKIVGHGARGVKIHPGEGRFMPDDPMLSPVYELLQNRGLPVISHGGLDIANPDPRYSRPSAFAGVLERYPDLRLVIAHLGKDFFEESLRLAEAHANVFFDTSSAIPGNARGEPLETLSYLSDEDAVTLIRKIGVDRVMFGSDYPWYHPHWDLKRFLKLDFTDNEMAALLAGNAKRVLGV
jgi:predicted TIM-barrel fold metal-dependent hydrolase